MPSPSGFALLGNALGGDSELAYQQGLNLGARTEDALSQARERVEKERARLGLKDKLVAAGVPDSLADASATTLAAGGGLGDVIGLQQKKQEFDFRNIAGSEDPNVDAGARNRALFGLAKEPTAPFKAVGSHGYQDLLHPEAGVMALGDAAGGGGDAAAIQTLRAFGLLDEHGRVAPENRQLAFDVMRSTERNVGLGGDVQGTVSGNPFAHAPGAAPTAHPVASPTDVAGNVAATAHAREVGKESGAAQINLPNAIADADKMSDSIDALIASPGFRGAYGHIVGQPTMSHIAGLADQDIANAQAARGNLSAQAFSVAIQKMRGLGQLSNAEGKHMTDAYTIAVNPTIDPDTAMKAWVEVKGWLSLAKQRAQQIANMTPNGAPPAAAAPPAQGGAMSLDQYLQSKGF